MALDPTDLGRLGRTVAGDAVSAEIAEDLLAPRHLVLAFRLRSWLWAVLGGGLAVGFLFCAHQLGPTAAADWSTFLLFLCALVTGQEVWHLRRAARAVEAEVNPDS